MMFIAPGVRGELRTKDMLLNILIVHIHFNMTVFSVEVVVKPSKRSRSAKRI